MVSLLQYVVFVLVLYGTKNKEKCSPDETYNHNELFLFIEEKMLLQECVKGEYSFVVDKTNPTKADRERHIQTARDR